MCTVASFPGPTQKIGKGAWCHLQYVPSYVTHPNNHIRLCHRLVMFITCKCSKECYNCQWTNVIPLLQTKTADIAHTGICASDTRPLSRFLGGAWEWGYVHWVKYIRRESVIAVLFKTTLKLLNWLFEFPFVQKTCVPGVVLRHFVPRTDRLQLSVVILPVWKWL